MDGQVDAGTFETISLTLLYLKKGSVTVQTFQTRGSRSAFEGPSEWRNVTNINDSISQNMPTLMSGVVMYRIPICSTGEYAGGLDIFSNQMINLFRSHIESCCALQKE